MVFKRSFEKGHTPVLKEIDDYQLNMLKKRCYRRKGTKNNEITSLQMTRWDNMVKCFQTDHLASNFNEEQEKEEVDNSKSQFLDCCEKPLKTEHVSKHFTSLFKGVKKLISKQPFPNNDKAMTRAVELHRFSRREGDFSKETKSLTSNLASSLCIDDFDDFPLSASTSLINLNSNSSSSALSDLLPIDSNLKFNKSRLSGCNTSFTECSLSSPFNVGKLIVNDALSTTPLPTPSSSYTDSHEKNSHTSTKKFTGTSSSITKKEKENLPQASPRLKKRKKKTASKNSNEIPYKNK